MSLLSPGTELKRFRQGTMPKVAVAVLLFIPLIYGALYLWAFWAPDKHMDALPIALVNLDEAARLSDGGTLAAGDQVVDALLDGGDLGWVPASADVAQAGVDDGTFAFAVTIPRDFSHAIASVGTPTPTTARVEVEYNETNSFLATTLGHHAMVQVRDAIAQTTSRETAKTMLVGVSTLADGVRTAADAALALDQGAVTLSDGAAQLDQGITAIAGGATTAATGGHVLSAGLATLEGGAADLQHGLTQLSQSTSSLPADSAALAAGATKVSTGVSTIAQLSAAHPSMTLAQLEATLEANGASLDALAAGATSVAAGATAVSHSAPELTAAVAQLDAGAAQVAEGAGKAHGGAQDLASGLDSLADGANAAASGSASVAEGASTLEEATNEFAQTLGEGAAAAPAYTDAQVEKVADVMAAPITLDEVTKNQVQGFGEGFAPFFIALATFVGALITWLILRPLPRRPLGTNASGLRAVMTGYVPAMLIAAGQVAIMMVVLVVGVGLRPEHLVATTCFVALTTLAFLALQQMFIILLGTAAGRVVSLVLLMLQLSSSGGTYPVETTPRFFGVLHPFMPATHVVNGLRALIGGGIDARFWTGLAFMTGLLVASLAVSAWAASRQKVWTIGRLHPELTV